MTLSGAFLTGFNEKNMPFYHISLIEARLYMCTGVNHLNVREISSAPLWWRACFTVAITHRRSSSCFNLEIKSDTPFLLSSSGASQDVTPPPPQHSQKPWMNTLAHTSHPLSPPHSISSSIFPLPPFSLCEGCLKGHDSIFNWEQLGGPSPREVGRKWRQRTLCQMLFNSTLT